MATATELVILKWVVMAFLLMNMAAYVAHLLLAILPESEIREAIRKICYELDRVADDMSNPEKRSAAIRQASEFLGWRKILVPAFLLGWAVDAEVRVIRHMQKVTQCKNLHEEGYENGKDCS